MAATLARAPARHGLELVVCTAHLYGVALYYATNYAAAAAAGRSFSRPEFCYYWVYYVGCNVPWVVPAGEPVAPPPPFSTRHPCRREGAVAVADASFPPLGKQPCSTMTLPRWPSPLPPSTAARSPGPRTSEETAPSQPWKPSQAVSGYLIL